MLGLSGTRNHVSAALYRPEDKKRKSPIYEIEGAWNDQFTIRDVESTQDLETYNTNADPPTQLQVAPIDEQDPWESRRAWSGVINALEQGNMQTTSDEKAKVEQAQRAMRKTEEANGTSWSTRFFYKASHDEVFERLATEAGDQHKEDAAHGFWKFDLEKLKSAKRPLHGDLLPDTA